eukprot:3246119-Pyramimonas_sp.AAC.1
MVSKPRERLGSAIARDFVEFELSEPTRYCQPQKSISHMDRIFCSLPGWSPTRLASQLWSRSLSTTSAPR